jgi:serine/threonine protein phosphatase PrpC
MDAPCPPRTWTQPKAGGKPFANQDAYAITAPETDGGDWLIAVCDGASSSAFARSWAQHLANAVEDSWFDDQVDSGPLFEDVRSTFDPLASRPDIDFVLADKWREEGSHATLAAARVTPTSEGMAIAAIGVGDTVVAVASLTSLELWPISAPEEFTSRPPLVSCQPGAAVNLNRGKMVVGPGELLILATDGVGKWLATAASNRPRAAVELIDVLWDDKHAPLRETMHRVDESISGAELEDDLTLVCIASPALARHPKQITAANGLREVVHRLRQVLWRRL